MKEKELKELEKFIKKMKRRLKTSTA